jgi:hypothetical protein
MTETQVEAQITTGQDNSDLEQMDQQQLIEEMARLQRSKGNNPGEEPWSKELFARLQRVEEKLKELEYRGDKNKDLELMNLEQLAEEINKLEKSKGDNPDYPRWKIAWQARLNKAYALKKIIAPNL